MGSAMTRCPCRDALRAVKEKVTQYCCAVLRLSGQDTVDPVLDELQQPFVA